MVSQTETVRRLRYRRTLHSLETFADDLGELGRLVGPRLGPTRRTTGQREDWCLRRLLIAWRLTRRLVFPITIEAEGQPPRRHYPDFTLYFSKKSILGLEATEAGSQEFQAWMTDLERDGGGPKLMPGDGYTPAGEIQSRAEDQVRAIKRKIEKFKAGAYSATPVCDLVVYDNTESTGLDSIEKVLAALPERAALIGHFHKIHVIDGQRVALDVSGNDCAVIDISRTYEQDFFAWSYAQAEAVRSGAFHEIDIENVAEEVESLGRSDRRALRSQLTRLLVHLLKWRYQAANRSKSWHLSIIDARRKIETLVDDSPSLEREVTSQLGEQYSRARKDALVEMDLPDGTIPGACPFTFDQILDEEFLPDGDSDAQA